MDRLKETIESRGTVSAGLQVMLKHQEFGLMEARYKPALRNDVLSPNNGPHKAKKPTFSFWSRETSLTIDEDSR